MSQDSNNEEEKIVEEVNDEEIIEEVKEKKESKHIIVNMMLVILFIISLISFGILLIKKDTLVISIISGLILTMFTILYVVSSITYRRKKKGIIFLSSLLLISYFLISINNYFSFIELDIEGVPDFQGKSLTSVMKWADKNNITVEQDYEYSDMVDEYQVISQSIPSGTSLKKAKNMVVSISEGANPSKEIMVPSMKTWKSERVLNFILENHLNNVVVDFVESDQEVDTVIEQNTSGNMKRDDELKLTFSEGEELGYNEVKLIDFTNKSRFEVEFYMKQHHLNYEFKDDFSSKVKKGYAFMQSKKAGEVVKINDEKVEVTISKGPKIKVPDLEKMSLTDITKWAIKNKIKINFSDKYDDKIKENKVIEASSKKGDIIEQGSVLKVVISRGGLKMPSFKSLSDFYNWANKYEIAYEEEHEFSDKVPVGEVISYSYKTGEVIKNGDVIRVVISDGDKTSVPNLKGLSKNEAKNKLDKLGMKYSFIYNDSSEKKDTVIGQSIRAGSEISKGTSISITLSNGKKEGEAVNKRKTDDTPKKESEKKSTNNSNNSNNNSNSNTNTQKKEEQNNTPTPTPEPTPEPVSNCNSCTITGIKGVISTNIDGGYGAVSSALVSSIQAQCPGIKVNINGDDTSGKRSGLFISGFSGGTTDSCSTVSITLAK